MDGKLDSRQKLITLKSKIRVTITEVLSPVKFQVKLIQEDETEELNFKKHQKILELRSIRVKDLGRIFEAKVGKFCVIKNPDSGFIQRVQILSVKKDTQGAHFYDILLIDEGTTSIAEKHHLYDLPEKIGLDDVPPLTFQAVLIGFKPQGKGIAIISNK